MAPQRLRTGRPTLIAQACARLLPLAALALLPSGGGCAALRGGHSPTAADLARCRAFAQQAHAAQERGETAQAELLFHQAIAACPADAEARCDFADLLTGRGAHSAALAQLDQARNAAPDDPQLAVRSGELLLQLGRPEDAWYAARTALDIDPQCGPAWVLRGRTMAATGQWAIAVTDYERALGCETDRADVLWLLASAQRAAGQPQQALASLEALGEVYPPNEEPPQWLAEMGAVHAALGSFEEARRCYLASIDRQGPTAELWYRLAEAELGAGRADRAATAAQQALSLQPAHASALALAGRLSAVAAAPQAPLR